MYPPNEINQVPHTKNCRKFIIVNLNLMPIGSYFENENTILNNFTITFQKFETFEKFPQSP